MIINARTVNVSMPAHSRALFAMTSFATVQTSCLERPSSFSGRLWYAPCGLKPSMRFPSHCIVSCKGTFILIVACLHNGMSPVHDLQIEAMQATSARFSRVALEMSYPLPSKRKSNNGFIKDWRIMCGGAHARNTGGPWLEIWGARTLAWRWLGLISVEGCPTVTKVYSKIRYQSPKRYPHLVCLVST